MIAVPIFFMVTGYLVLGTSVGYSQKRLDKLLWKVFKLAVTANLIYIVFDLLTGEPLKINILRFIFLGEGANAYLWFLTAMFEALLCVRVIERFSLQKLVPYLILGGLVFNLLVGSWRWILFPEPNTILDNLTTGAPRLFFCQNVFATGLPFVLLGGLMGRLRKFPLSTLITIIVILCILSWGEVAFLRSVSANGAITGPRLLTALLLAPVVFLVFMQNDSDNRFVRITSGLGRKYSLDIYLYQYLVARLMVMAIQRLPFVIPGSEYWFAPVLFVLTIGWSELLNHTLRRLLHDRSHAVG